ncbi:hypothetical protein H5407_23610, partial [Mitsuaria sp. WAJ17]|nr:hypothetical protein [Mitsuaria sp. WAJ17]
MTKRLLLRALLGLGMAVPLLAQAVDNSAPDQLIRQLSLETIETVKADKAIQGGDVQKVITLVDTKVMPHVNF